MVKDSQRQMNYRTFRYIHLSQCFLLVDEIKLKKWVCLDLVSTIHPFTSWLEKSYRRMPTVKDFLKIFVLKRDLKIQEERGNTGKVVKRVVGVPFY